MAKSKSKLAQDEKMRDYAALATPVVGLIVVFYFNIIIGVILAMCFYYGKQSKKYRKVAIFGFILPIAIILLTLLGISFLAIGKARP